MRKLLIIGLFLLNFFSIASNIHAAGEVIVIPENPIINKPSCNVYTNGPKGNSITWPKDTRQIYYHHELDRYDNYILMAYTFTGNLFPQSLEGWEINSSRTSATQIIYPKDYDPCIVTPSMPQIQQSVCIPGEKNYTDPNVILPSNTNKIIYHIVGVIQAGNTISIVAQAQGSYYFAQILPGREISSNRKTATRSIQLIKPDCSEDSDPKDNDDRVVILTNPSITQTLCRGTQTIAPSIILPPSTAIITYSIEGTIAAGNTITVIAEVTGSYTIAPKTGRTLSANKKRAIRSYTFTKPNCNNTQNPGDTITDKCSIKNSPYDQELNKAYQFACGVGITTKQTIQEANILSPVIRIDFAKMSSVYATKILGKTPNIAPNCSFPDLYQVNTELANFAILSCQLNIMGLKTRNGLFWVHSGLMRAEVVSVLSRMYHRAIDNPNASIYFSNHMNILQQKGYITDITPNKLEMRGYVFIMLERIAYDNNYQQWKTIMTPFGY